MEVNIETLVVSGVFQVRFGSHQRSTHTRTVELHNNDELYFFEEPEDSLAKHLREKVYVDGARVIDCGSPGKSTMEVLALFLRDYDYAERVDTLGNRKDVLFEPSKALASTEAHLFARQGQFAVLLSSRSKSNKSNLFKALRNASHVYVSSHSSPVGNNAPAALPQVKNRFDDVLRGIPRDTSDTRRARSPPNSPSSSVSVLSDHEVLQLEDVLRAYDANQAALGSSPHTTAISLAAQDEEELPAVSSEPGCALTSPLNSPSGTSTVGAIPTRLMASPLYSACLENQPLNLACADCDESFPTWCVLQPFGVFVCIDCVGVHRRLWANRCREAEMDNWNAKDVTFMASRGNAITNAELEFDVSFPPDSVEATTGAPPPCKPYHHFSKVELRESYIRWKYEEKLFTQTAHPQRAERVVNPPRDPVGVSIAITQGGNVAADVCVSPTTAGEFSPPPGEQLSAALAPPRYTALVKLILKELNASACFAGATCVLSNGFQQLHSNPGRKLMRIANATAWDESVQLGVESPYKPLFCAVYNAKEELIAAAEFTLPQPIIDGAAGMLTIPLPWCELDKKCSHRSHKPWQLTALASFSELQ